MYNFDTNGRLFDDQGVEVPQDDRGDRYLAYLLWLSGDRAPGLIQAQEEPPTPEAVLEDAETWGRALVHQVELGLLVSGINEDRRVALAVDRELAEVSSKLKDGRLHIALAALEELLERPESERHAPDSMLKPIEALIRDRLDLEEGMRRG